MTSAFAALSTLAQSRSTCLRTVQSRRCPRRSNQKRTPHRRISGRFLTRCSRTCSLASGVKARSAEWRIRSGAQCSSTNIQASPKQAALNRPNLPHTDGAPGDTTMSLPQARIGINAERAEKVISPERIMDQLEQTVREETACSRQAAEATNLGETNQNSPASILSESDVCGRPKTPSRKWCLKHSIASAAPRLLQSLLRTNLTVLATAHAVSKVSFVRLRRARPQTGPRPMAPPVARRRHSKASPPLAISRTFS